MFCPKCGSENEDDVKFCAKCGSSLGESAAEEAVVVAEPAPSDSTQMGASIESHSTAQGATVTTINVQTPQVQKNPIGVAGFVLALIGVFISWVPVLGWIIWILGTILSAVGAFKKPKGMAIAGVCLSFINLILLLFVVASCSAIGSGAVAGINALA